MQVRALYYIVQIKSASAVPYSTDSSTDTVLYSKALMQVLARYYIIQIKSSSAVPYSTDTSTDTVLSSTALMQDTSPLLYCTDKKH
jgi:hypothetical protein